MTPAALTPTSTRRRGGPSAPAARRGAAHASGRPRLGDEDFRLLRELVHAHCGICLRDASSGLVERRLAARVAALGLDTFAQYHRFLAGDRDGPGELEEALDVLTTNETWFYRAPHQLDAFAREILPELARDRAGERRLRLVSAGCSTGEEAYTLAMLVKESRLFEGWDVEVVGCDISRRCIARAQAAAYGEHAFRAPEAQRLRRWFRRRGEQWSVDGAIRRMVRFERENLLDPRALASAAGADALFCRNVMIYFDAGARTRVLRTLHGRLREGGWLLLGHSESVPDVTGGLEPVPLRSELAYRKPIRARAGEEAG
jgi:chemotaxis protein methyltransferase CheR